MLKAYSLTPKGVCASCGLNYTKYLRNKEAYYLVYGQPNSGRTTNILIEALVQASKGIEIVIVGVRARESKLLQNRAKNMAWWCGLEPEEVVSDRHVPTRPRYWKPGDKELISTSRFFEDHPRVLDWLLGDRKTYNLIRRFMRLRLESISEDTESSYFIKDTVDDALDLRYTLWQLGGSRAFESYAKITRHKKGNKLHLHYEDIKERKAKLNRSNPYADSLDDSL